MGRQEVRGTRAQQRELAQAIAKARVALGMGRDELAHAIGRTEIWVRRIERGDGVLSAFEYARIASILGLPPALIEAIAWGRKPVPRPEGPKRLSDLDG